MIRTQTKKASIQFWNFLTEKYFDKSLRIEVSKDREEIYTQLDKLKLKREKYVSLTYNDRFTNEFKKAIHKVGIPYWLSIVPKSEKLNRLTMLNVNTLSEGKKFIKGIKDINKYKILVIQYPTDILFKGSALVAVTGNGIAEFVKGDHHLNLIAGKTIEDPLLFKNNEILHFSNLIPQKYQKELVGYIKNNPGHYEFQYANLNGKRCFSFFDYNNEPAYENVDGIFHHLESKLLSTPGSGNNIICSGLPVSEGIVSARCRIIKNVDYSVDSIFKKGEILVTDFTSPDMVPLISKASAIVTDLGGVTSHAAIVCRELGIPCVSGTKNATAKIKNGELITVDAINGSCY